MAPSSRPPLTSTGSKRSLVPGGDEGDKKGAGRESLNAEVVGELCAAFCRDSGSEDKSVATEKFRHALITNANDETIRIQNMRLGTHIGVCLSKVLKNHPLSTLDLFGNVIRDVGTIALLQLIRVQPTIKHLNLGSNDLSHESGIAIARDLAQVALETLELGADDSPLHGNRFNSKVGVALADQLSTNTCLQVLGLNGTGIGRCEDKSLDPKQEACATFRTALAVNSCLRVLRLSHNNLGTEGCVLILQGLAANACLQELDLSHNNATAELGVVVGKALAAANTSLTTLLLAGNKLGASGGCAMAASIVTNTSLKVLKVQDCGMRDRGSIALANALEVPAPLLLASSCCAGLPCCAIAKSRGRCGCAGGWLTHARRGGARGARRRTVRWPASTCPTTASASTGGWPGPTRSGATPPSQTSSCPTTPWATRWPSTSPASCRGTRCVMHAQKSAAAAASSSLHSPCSLVSAMPRVRTAKAPRRPSPSAT